jgi:dihydrodipicolinate synthase/N-acetylneuraminate lyase
MAQVKTRYPQNKLAACFEPWTPDFKLDVPVFERHIQAALDEGYTCLYLMGTAGEGYALNDALFQQIVEVYSAITVRDGLDPQIGVISTSMLHILDRIAFCYDKGIRMFQLSLPSWGALDDNEMMLFFKTVCGEFPDCRFLHYNVPRAKRILTGSDYRRVCDQVPNLVATKISTHDYARIKDVMTHAPDLQHFFLENSFALGCTMGECSLLCSFGGLCPRTTQRLFEAGQRRDLDELFRITELFNKASGKLFGHLQRTIIDGAFDKTVVQLLDPEFSNRILPPYLGFTEEETRICQEAYEREVKHID